MPEVLGWGSSLVLLATIAYQVASRWHAEDDGGVRAFPYVGQAVASGGFLACCIAAGNRMLTNGCLLAAARIGLAIHRRNARLGATG